MNLIEFLLRASWVNVAIAALMGAGSGGCSVLLIALINHTINSSAASTPQLLWAFVGLAIGGFLTSLWSRLLLVTLSQSAVYKLRLRLSGWILACPLQHLEKLGANKILATLTDDVQSISNAVFNIPFLCIDIALVAGYLLYLSWLSWQVFLVVLALLAGTIAVIQVFIGQANRLMELAREEQDHLFKHFRAMTDGIKELKLHRSRRTAFLTEELQTTAATARDYKVSALTIWAIASSLGEVLFFVILGLLVFAIPQFVTISAPVMSGYILTITFITRPLQSILEILPGLNQASVSLQKVDALGLSLASQAEETEESLLIASPLFQSIELIQVTHAYHQEQEERSFVLGAIDLTFHAGELVFIVGGNGSGKSTLAKLIIGLYIPESGKICLDGIPITHQNREAYRQLFTAVFSDFFLFERMLGIHLSNLDAQAQSYLDQLQLAHKVRVEEGVLSTIDLSQGQRKRLALLTAYLEDRPIYLFDEWASDQDPFFREIFYKQLLPELKTRGKTVLVISHDDRYFHLADRLLKLDYGKLV
jgi:putative pyoverdin transport system ATP-binding/permease protein